MRGLVGMPGQGMNGSKGFLPKLVGKVSTSRDGSVTLAEDVVADIFAWGGGASGSPGTIIPYGGGGGSAGHSRLVLPRGTVISWTAGAGGLSSNGGSAPGGDTVVSINGIVHGTAQGGRQSGDGGPPAPRSTATGFQVNRYGGGSNEAGEHGTPPLWAGSGLTRVGGGAGGFNDLFIGTSGEGTNTNSNSSGSVPAVAQPAAGGDAPVDTSYSVYGGRGRVEINLYRLI